MNSDKVRELINAGKITCPFCGTRPKLTPERAQLAIRALQHYKTACKNNGSAFADSIDSTIAALASPAEK